MLAIASPALAVVPHVSAVPETDTCAMCHRTHTAASSILYRGRETGEFVDSALIVGTADTDVELCYVCHGVVNLGSPQDVQTDFEKTSAHSLAPEESPYGPTPKGCSDCHDSHGTKRDTGGNPMPGLLRSFAESRTPVYAGDEYCAACHADRADDTWDGLAVWRQTGHASLPAPSSGTGVVCLNCHAKHGSGIAPLVREQLVPPSVTSTATVQANDRGLCLICHPSDEGTTWRGETVYETSSHAESSATIAISGEWPAAGATRRAGECQACHAPMGTSDGAGGVVPKLAASAGRALCDECHDTDGPARTDLASMVPTTAVAAFKELAIAYQPATAEGSYGRVSVYSQDATTSSSRTLGGVREFGARDAASDPAGSASGYGALAFGGDTQGDGEPDLVIADPGVARLRFLSPAPLTGLAERTHPLAASRPPAQFVAVGDFLYDAGGSLEIAIVASRTATDAADAYLYRERIQSGTTVLDEVAGPIFVGRGVTGVAAGDVAGDTVDELVVTAGVDGDFFVLRDNSGTWEAASHSAGGSLPRGPSIGDAWPGGSKDEIVLLRGTSPGEVAVFGGDGSLEGAETVSGTGEASATAVGDILPGIDRDEVVVSLDAGSGTSSLRVFPQDSGGLDGGAVQSYDTGSGYRSSAVVIGQLDGDAAPELVVGNAGWTQASSTGWVSPSVQVFHADSAGTALSGVQRLWGGGTELSGGAPSLAIADLGALGSSSHPIGAVPGAHVSTEAADPDPLARHVECVDCHNVHEATSTPTAIAGSAPDVYGRLEGAWGVEVDNISASSIEFTERHGVAYEYEVCLKCHSAWSESAGGRDIAREFNTYNPSFHGVEGAPGASMPSGSFETTTPAWTGDSRLYCADCHGNADSGQPRGPHASSESPLLKAPYLGTLPSNGEMLCYLCHDIDVYESGAGAVTSTDFRSSNTLNLHVRHVGDQGLGCGSCHIGHGSMGEVRLLRTDLGFSVLGAGGTCDGACHDGSSETYAR